MVDSPPTRWVLLPWEAELPWEITATGRDVEVVDQPVWQPEEVLGWDGAGNLRYFSSYQPPPRVSDVSTDNHRWVLGWTMDPRHKRDHVELVGSARTRDGAEVARWDLGRGSTVLCALAR